jgi:hypothetical protein
MNTAPPEFSDLFAQLGLPSDEASIQRFIRSHPLADDVFLDQARCWTPAQARLLRESLPSPVRGGGPVSPELDRVARLAVSQLAGHARVRASGAYLGSIVRKSGQQGLPSDPPTGPKPGDDDAAAVAA